MFNWDGVPLRDDKKGLERDAADDFTTVLMYLMSLNSTLKNGKNGKFYVMYILSKKKKEKRVAHLNTFLGRFL